MTSTNFSEFEKILTHIKVMLNSIYLTRNGGVKEMSPPPTISTPYATSLFHLTNSKESVVNAEGDLFIFHILPTQNFLQNDLLPSCIQ